MFEKEFEIYKNQSKWKGKIFMKDEEICFKDGIEYALNEINKWHNLEENPNDLPKENMKQVIVGLSDGSYEMGYYCIHNKTWWNNDCPDYDDELGYHDIKNDIHIVPIKWKEII